MGILGSRAKVCRSETLFEELEERIVLDASVGQDWDLEYSSDPSADMSHLLATGDLADFSGDLGTPAPSISMGIVPPTNGATVVDLSGSVRINGDPTVNTMHCVVTLNPRPLTSNYISSLSFSETTIFGVTLDEPGTGVAARSWNIEGPYDSVNAILATMQANIVPGAPAGAFAEIDVTLTDPDHDTNVNSAPLVTRTLYIPITAGAGGSASSGPIVHFGALSGSTDTWTWPGGAAFTTLPNVPWVEDAGGHVVDVGIRSAIGRLQFNGAVPTNITVLHDPVTGPPASPGANNDVVSWVYMRGPVPAINQALSILQYAPIATYGTDSHTQSDTLEIIVDDRMAIAIPGSSPTQAQNPLTGGNPPWARDPISRVGRGVVSISAI